MVVRVEPLRLNESTMCFAGALHGVLTRQTGAMGPRSTVPWPREAEKPMRG